MSFPTPLDLVRGAFAAIDQHRWREAVIPHGFEVLSVTEQERRNPFAPGLASRRVTVHLAVPVLYSPDSSSGRLRAALPAHRDNLDILREWVVAELGEAPGCRVSLREWRVSPDEPPAPYLPSGKVNGPPADWDVTAVFDIGLRGAQQEAPTPVRFAAPVWTSA